MISKCVSMCVCLSLSHTSLSLSISTQENSNTKGLHPLLLPLHWQRQQPCCQGSNPTWIWKSGGETAQSKQLGKGKGGMLGSKSLHGKARKLLLLPWPSEANNPARVCLPELRGQALPLTFQRGVICKCTVIWKVHCEKCQGAALSILWRAQLGASLKTKQLWDWWSGMHR